MIDAKKPDYNKEKINRVTLKTVDGEIVSGFVHLGTKGRVSELFTKKSDPFIVLSNVCTKKNKGTVLIINKLHIVWVEPEENIGY